MTKTTEQPCNGAEQHEEDPTMDDESAAKEKLTDGDPSMVKFTCVDKDGKNGDTKIDIHVAQTTVGMGKEELMKYANEPFWVRLRMFLFIFFWVAWLAMLVGAVVIIILAPRCPPAPKIEWYQKSAMYQVDVETFKDSDDSGVGDFKGLASKLDYFKEQNIDALMLSTFYKSTEEGIVDHKEIDERFGTLADFDDLVAKLKEKDIRLVIDFNPNHSSDEHPWFVKSKEGQEPYNDYYVWAERSSNGKEPNNWLNIHGESAWTWNDDRQQYYLSTFGKNMPELNLRNELLKVELKEIIQFWMDKGVDGFKVVAASHLIEDSNLRDEPLGTLNKADKKTYKNINHIFTLDQPENIGLFTEWKEVLNNYTASSGVPKILMPELSGSLNMSSMYYGNETFPLAELPFNVHFAEFNQDATGTDLKEYLESQMNHVPASGWPTHLVGSKSVPRLASRVGEDLVDAIHMIATFAKGTPITYYADELGISDPEEPAGSAKLQCVMLWNNESFSGFTNTSTTLHVHPNYKNQNVEVQEKNKQSHLKIFSRLLALRSQPAVNFGLQQYPLVTSEVFSLIRVRKGSPGYLVVVNLADKEATLDFSQKNGHLPDMARVEIRSSNVVDGLLAEGDHPKVNLNNVVLGPKQSVVLSFVPVFEG